MLCAWLHTRATPFSPRLASTAVKRKTLASLEQEPTAVAKVDLRRRTEGYGTYLHSCVDETEQKVARSKFRFSYTQ